MHHLPAPWSAAPERPRLEQTQIHLWRFHLDLPAAEISQLERLLTEDELIRAKRLLDPRKSRSFVAARGRLRQILADYLEVPAETIRFSYESSGKPKLATVHASDLSFNLAHSGKMAVLGIGKGQGVGVDLERIDPELAFDQMAAQFFSAAEFSCLSNLAGLRRRRGFYRIWTGKEAWLKSQGWGFSGPTDQRNLPGGIPAGPGWKLIHFPLARGYVGAVAFSETVTEILRFDRF
ncbi:4'-phosphopantetheinyl transferase family protein [Trichloromonas sp.]|uniref:4'-phosphopantetheinyl transferase family protein n=1 Tax=Trichloromonas sp. TaxID=3069249 RepID=UPI003D81C15E